MPEWAPEAVAVALAVAYLALAIRQSVWCWPAAIASAVIYVRVFAGSGLYLQAVLQLFYIGLAVYGWRRWSAPDRAGNVVRWPLVAHAGLLGVGLIAALCLAWLGARVDATVPLATRSADALITSGSVLATWLVARKVLENWHWWFVVDSGAALLYAAQGLRLTSVLFVAYLVMIVVGFRAWRRQWVATLN
jgi:nicotinamide mononucleotide transporter